MSECGELIDPSDLDPWRAGVRRAAGAVGLIELPSTRYIELSPRARELVGADAVIGLDLLVPKDRKEAAAITEAATAGVIDGTEARRRRWQRPDGSVVEVMVRARAVRLGDKSVGLWVARDLSGAATDSDLGASGDVVDGPAGRRSAADPLVAILDDSWRVDHLTGDVEHLGGALREDVAVTAVTHPDDMARLLFAFAGATTQVDATTRVRLLTAGESITVDVEVSRLGHHSWRVAFTPVHDREAGAHHALRRVRDLEGSLRRIAGELQGAGMVHVPATTVDVLRVPGVRELPQRQQEIVVRLARGERVGTIAARMYLSANTVRNHLSVVYRKFGVHSQQELLVLLRGEEGDEATSTT